MYFQSPQACKSKEVCLNDDFGCIKWFVSYYKKIWYSILQFIFVELKTNLLKLKQIFPLSSPSRIKGKFIPFFISYIVRFFLRQFLCYNVTPMSYFPWRHLLFIFLNEVKTIFVFEYVRYPWRPFNHLKTLNAEASRKFCKYICTWNWNFYDRK